MAAPLYTIRRITDDEFLVGIRDGEEVEHYLLRNASRETIQALEDSGFTRLNFKLRDVAKRELPGEAEWEKGTVVTVPESALIAA